MSTCIIKPSDFYYFADNCSVFLASASDADATGSLRQIEKQLINVNQSDIPADLRDQSNTALRFRNRWPDGKACIAGTEKLAMTAKSDRTPAPFPKLTHLRGLFMR